MDSIARETAIFMIYIVWIIALAFTSNTGKYKK